MKILFVLAGALLAGCGVNAAEALNESDLLQAEQQAQVGLVALKRSVTTNGAIRLGFASTNEVHQAVLGQPFRVYRISVAKASNYTPGVLFSTLIEPAPRVIFPLVVNQTNKSSLVVHRGANGWLTEKRGGFELIKQLTTTRLLLASNVPPSVVAGSFAVEIPVIGLWFLGYTNPANDRVDFLTTGNVRLGATNIPPQTQVSTNLMAKVAQLAGRYQGRSN